jgi:hypothetical protein
MKKKLSAILVSVFFATSVLGGTAFAAGTDDAQSTAGITPDSILYPVERLIEDIQLALTGNEIDKAELLTENAQERLAEAQIMMDEGKTELAQEAANDYTETVDKTGDILQNQVDENAGETPAPTDGATVTPPAEGTTETPAEPSPTPTVEEQRDALLQQLLLKNLDLQKNSVDVLAALLDKVPEAEKEELIATIVKQILHTEAVKNFVEAKKAYNDGRKDVKDAERNLRKAGDTDKAAAQKALDDANAALTNLEITKDTAWEQKKDINNVIAEQLKAMGITAPVDDEDKDAPEEDEATVTPAPTDGETVTPPADGTTVTPPAEETPAPTDGTQLNLLSQSLERVKAQVTKAYEVKYQKQVVEHKAIKNQNKEQEQNKSIGQGQNKEQNKGQTKKTESKGQETKNQSKGKSGK